MLIVKSDHVLRLIFLKEEFIMICPQCGKEMKNGYLFGSKDGALSFASEVPSVFENAKNTVGFVKLTVPKVGGRVRMEACCCDECKMIIIKYKEER